MQQKQFSAINESSFLLSTHKVLRNTYFLLSLTLLFSALTATFATITHVSMMNPILSLVGWFGLYFLTIALRNSGWGIVAIFAFTGFTGYALGPVLNTVIQNFSNGSQIVAASLGATGFIFLVLSGYVLTTKKDFNYLGGFLFIAMIVGLLGSIATLFFNAPMLHVGISALFVLIASGLILFDTSRIVNGGEQNYIMATIQLYIDLYMLFIQLLNLLSIFAGKRD